MKKSIYSLLLAFVVLVSFSGCKKDCISTRQNHIAANSLNGKWNLVRIYGGIMGANETHLPGEIEWTFNTQNSTVIVNNTIGNSSYYNIPSGIYNFQEISNASQNYLVINSNQLGQFVFSGNQLLIDGNKQSTSEGACGFYFELER